MTAIDLKHPIIGHSNQFVGWMQEGRKCILMIFQEKRFSDLQ